MSLKYEDSKKRFHERQKIVERETESNNYSEENDQKKKKKKTWEARWEVQEQATLRP